MIYTKKLITDMIYILYSNKVTHILESYIDYIDKISWCERRWELWVVFAPNKYMIKKIKF